MIRHPLNQIEISRHDLKCKSSDLENLVIGDKIIYSDQNEDIEGKRISFLNSIQRIFLNLLLI